MLTDEAKKKIEGEEDFVYLPRFNFSISKALERYPEGLPTNKLIAQALLVTEDEVEVLYKKAVRHLRRLMKVKVDDRGEDR